MIHRYPPHHYEYAARQHQYMIEKWYQMHGVPFAPDNRDEWDSGTRVLKSGNFTAVTKTPPPWVGKAV